MGLLIPTIQSHIEQMVSDYCTIYVSTINATKGRMRLYWLPLFNSAITLPTAYFDYDMCLHRWAEYTSTPNQIIPTFTCERWFAGPLAS